MTIKSTGRGTIAILNGTSSATATITAVVLANTQLRYLGEANGVAASTGVYLSLTNTTTITASMGPNSVGTTTVSYEYTEWQ